MFARMATFGVSDVTAVEKTGERIRAAVEPVVEGLQGWKGAVQMLDREGGKLAVINFFDTKENMEAAESTFEVMPDKFDDELKEQIRRIASGRQSVEKFELLANRFPGS